MYPLIIAAFGLVLFGLRAFVCAREGLDWLWRKPWSFPAQICVFVASLACYYGGLYRYGVFQAPTTSLILILLGSFFLLGLSDWLGKSIAEGRNTLREHVSVSGRL